VLLWMDMFVSRYQVNLWHQNPIKLIMLNHHYHGFFVDKSSSKKSLNKQDVRRDSRYGKK